jgi:hypothetical protein
MVIHYFKNFTLLKYTYGDDIHVIRHSHLPHALPATGLVTGTAQLFLSFSFTTHVYSIAASLASLPVYQCCVPSDGGVLQNVKLSCVAYVTCDANGWSLE